MNDLELRSLANTVALRTFWYRERCAMVARTGKPHYFTAHGHQWLIDVHRRCWPVLP